MHLLKAIAREYTEESALLKKEYVSDPDALIRRLEKTSNSYFKLIPQSSKHFDDDREFNLVFQDFENTLYLLKKGYACLQDSVNLFYDLDTAHTDIFASMKIAVLIIAELFNRKGMISKVAREYNQDTRILNSLSFGIRIHRN